MLSRTVLLLMVNIPHDLIHPNHRHYGSIAYRGHARFFSSTVVVWACASLRWGSGSWELRALEFELLGVG